MATRQNIANLSSAELASWRRVTTASMGLQDNRGYVHFAGMHGLPNQYCQHGTTLFLPWHRAYLYMLEMAMRDIDNTIALPWWDWTSDEAHAQGLPAAYTDASVANNPLLSGVTGLPQRTLQRIQAQVPDTLDFTANPPHTVRAPGPPGELPSAETIESILQAPTFDDFTAQLEDQQQPGAWLGRRVDGDRADCCLRPDLLRPSHDDRSAVVSLAAAQSEWGCWSHSARPSAAGDAAQRRPGARYRQSGL